MNLKNIFVMALIIVALFGTLFGQPAYAANGAANLETYVADISPNPVEPGSSNLLINIILKNTGTDTALDATATLKAVYPFTLKTIQNDVSQKDICSGCSSIITYALAVDAEAKSGAYPVEFEVSHGVASRLSFKNTVNINVVGVPRITFDAVVSDKITPKSEFEVAFDFKNIGTGRASNIKISSASQDFVISGGSPIIDFLQSGETNKMSVKFISSPNIAPNIYSIPITLNYVDELGASRESISNLGISVLGNSDLIIKNIKIEPASIISGDSFTVTARVQNIGYGDAKEVVIELDAPYSGYKKAFIGKLGKDEDAPAIFNLAADSPSSPATLTMKYRDDFGEHEKTEKFTINVAERQDNTELYAGIFIVVLLLVIVYRLQKKKK